MFSECWFKGLKRWHGRVMRTGAGLSGDRMLAARAESWLNDLKRHVAAGGLLMSKCFVVLLNLLSVSPLLAQSQPVSHYPMCFPVGHLAVGEVRDKPFTATVVEVEQQVPQAGLGVPDENPTPVGIIARDSQGRVMGRWKRQPASDAPDGSGNPWEITICDPQTGGNTSIAYHRQESSSEERLPLIPSDAREVFARELPLDGRSTVIFSWWHRTVNCRDNLGEEIFEGLRAFRYRLTCTQRERSGRDVVNSDDLFLQLAQTTWKSYPTTEENMYLTKIKRDEPEISLFEIPAGIAVVQDPRNLPTR
jgi:hypothetical protein